MQIPSEIVRWLVLLAAFGLSVKFITRNVKDVVMRQVRAALDRVVAPLSRDYPYGAASHDSNGHATARRHGRCRAPGGARPALHRALWRGQERALVRPRCGVSLRGTDARWQALRGRDGGVERLRPHRATPCGADATAASRARPFARRAQEE